MKNLKPHSHYSKFRKKFNPTQTIKIIEKWGWPNWRKWRANDGEEKPKEPRG
jgi:hypothetical protein